jgi:hypothetical protein
MVLPVCPHGAHGEPEILGGLSGSKPPRCFDEDFWLAGGEGFHEHLLLKGSYRAGILPGARSPNLETWDRICKLFGWPQTFAVTGTRGAD